MYPALFERKHIGSGQWIITMSCVEEYDDLGNVSQWSDVEILAKNLDYSQSASLLAKFRKIYRLGGRDKQAAIARRLTVKS